MTGYNVNCKFYDRFLSCTCPSRQVQRSFFNPLRYTDGTKSRCIEYGTMKNCPDADRFPRPAPPSGGSSAKKPAPIEIHHVIKIKVDHD